MATTSPVLATKAALVTAVRALAAEAQVVYGTPTATLYAQDVIVVGNAAVTVTRPTMGTRRTREHTIDFEVLISSYRPGGDEQQQSASEAALALLERFSDYLRISPNETLGGACRDAWVTSYALAETDEDEATGGGRLADVTATVTVTVRT